MPNYAFAETIGNLILFTQTTVYGPGQPVWSWKVTGYPLLYMAAEVLLYGLGVLAIEKVLASPKLLQALRCGCRNQPTEETMKRSEDSFARHVRAFVAFLGAWLCLVEPW